MDVMVTASEVVTEFVREQDSEERQGEGQSAGQRERLPVQQRERAHEFVPGDGLILRVGCGEVRPCYQARAKGQQKQRACDDQSLQRRVPGDRRIVRRRDRGGAPVDRACWDKTATVWE